MISLFVCQENRGRIKKYLCLREKNVTEKRSGPKKNKMLTRRTRGNGREKMSADVSSPGPPAGKGQETSAGEGT